MPYIPGLTEEFDNLYQFLNRKYPLMQVNHRIAGEEFSLFSVKEIDLLLDELIEKGPEHQDVKDERLPYWAELWPSALALARFVLEHPEQVRNREVLEIGCGLGLAGLAAGKIGAEVLETDYQEDALRLAALNWFVNLQRFPQTALLDWRNPQIDRRFAVILASDVAYERRHFWPLALAFETLLQPGGRILLSEPNRPIARDFFNILREEGFFLERREMKIPFEDRQTTVSVYEITRDEIHKK